MLNYVKFALEIEDSGVGISPENLKHIFIDFGKLEEHSKINQIGTGLGLSICKQIVEKMRGRINVESTVNVGTTFRVLISTKVMLEKEPRFIRKFKIQNKQVASKNIPIKSPRRSGGSFIRLSSNSLSCHGLNEYFSDIESS